MKLPKLSNISVDGSTVGDVYFPNVSLLLPFDGSNGATSTSDSSNQNHTVTFNGAQISSAQSKFGGTSLLLDGSNDYLSIGGAEWNSNLNSGDFTVEFWIRFDTVGSGEQRIITNYNGNNGWGVALWSGGGGTDYFDGYWYDGSWRYMQYNIGGSSRYTTPSINTWYHVAFVRNGNDWGLYLNGTAESTRTVSGSIISSSLGSLEVGRQHQGNYFVDGYMDDLRITKGLARYTSNFTPPTSTHLTQAGDVNKQIIVNSAADGVAIGTGGINQARIAKAWVNFDADPSVSIRQSYNVSSITDTATGRFTINFSTAMLDADYCFSGSGGNQTGTTSGGRMVGPDGTKTTSALPVRYVTWGSTGTRNVYDNDYHCLIVFGN